MKGLQFGFYSDKSLFYPGDWKALLQESFVMISKLQNLFSLLLSGCCCNGGTHNRCRSSIKEAHQRSLCTWELWQHYVCRCSVWELVTRPLDFIMRLLYRSLNGGQARNRRIFHWCIFPLHLWKTVISWLFCRVTAQFSRSWSWLLCLCMIKLFASMFFILEDPFILQIIKI